MGKKNDKKDLIQNSVCFSLFLTATNTCPNGDPLNGNAPREINGYGHISTECLKRKIRNRFQDMGEDVLVALKGRGKDDEVDSIQNRMNREKLLVEADKSASEEDKLPQNVLLNHFIDVRMFGAVIASKAKTKDGEESDGRGVSIGIRGAASVQGAMSVDPIDVHFEQITKCINGEGDGVKKGSDTMGSKQFVDFAMYRVDGYISANVGRKNGVTTEDVAKLKRALSTLFKNDFSGARSEGSMEVVKLVWWEQNDSDDEENISSALPMTPAAIYRTVQAKKKETLEDEYPREYSDYEIKVNAPKSEAVKTEILDFV